MRLGRSDALHAVAAEVLRPVERAIHFAVKAVAIAVARRVESADADADRHREPRAVELRRRFVQTSAETFGEADRFLFADTAQQDAELLAAEAREQGIAAGERLLQARGEIGQAGIAGGMAMVVVDAFEVVDVHQAQARQAAAAHAAALLGRPAPADAGLVRREET